MDISGWTTSGVENMASMFYSSGVRKVTFPSANGSFSSATDISSMFQNCVDLTTVENFILNTDSESTAAAPSVSLPALTNANSLFGGCVGLKNVKFKLSAPVLEKLNQVFSNCDNLVCADLSGSNFSKLNNANQMFNSCGALTKVILNNVNMSSFTGKFVNAQGNTQDCVPFNDCLNLKHLEMRSIILTSVPNLSSFVRTTIEHFDMSGATVTGITSLEKLFASKTNLNYVDISNVTWGSYTSAYWMFYGCENLQTINVSGFKAPSNCQEMFMNCYNSTNLDLSGMDTEAVEIMDGMFKNCRSFAGFDSTAWEGTGWTTKNVKSMTQMFMDCCTTTGPNVSVGTYTINISNFDFSKVESFKEMFNCDKKTGKDLACTIILPSGTLAEAKAATVTTNRMFRNRKNLTSLVNIDQFYVENNHTDSGSMFANTGLTTINIRRLDLNKVSSNAQYMFNECSKLTTIYVNPDLATNNTFTTKFSGTMMFEGCSTNLVGEDGTRWANNKNVWFGKHARIGSGYFTSAPTPPPEDPNP
jgi:hypothetical protein